MTLNTLSNGLLTPADVAEHQVQTNALIQSIAVKALKTNASNVLIGGKENVTFPLAPGEQLTMDLKGAKLFYKMENAADKLAFFALAP